MKAPALPGESILCHGVSAHLEADPSLSIPARDTRLQCHTVTTFLQVARTYVYLYVVFSMWYVLWLLKSNGLNNPGKNMKAAILTKQTKNQGCSPVHGTMASLIPPWTQESNPYKGTALRGAPVPSGWEEGQAGCPLRHKQEASPPRPQAADPAPILSSWTLGRVPVAVQTLLPTSLGSSHHLRGELRGMESSLPTCMGSIHPYRPEAHHPLWPFFPSVVTSSW